MKVATTDGRAFTLDAENETDRQLIDAMDLVRHVAFVGPRRAALMDGGWCNQGCTLLVDFDSPQRLVANAQRDALKALGQLFRLGLREAADQVHAGAAPANPDTQEALAALCVQLQLVLQALRPEIEKREVVIEKVDSGHSPSGSAAASVDHAQGGAA
jgi:hypothetical protein